MDFKKFFIEDNRSGWKCVESKLSNKHPKVYSLVVGYAKKNNLSNLPFKEQVYCFIHEYENRPTCGECGKDVKYKNITIGYQDFCGVKCANSNKEKQNKIKQTNLTKYGSTTAMQNPKIAKKIKEKNLKKYGVDNVFKSEEIKAKIKEVMLDKYGVTSPIQNPDIRKKIESTNLDKYGNETYLGSDEANQVIGEIFIEKYGVDNPFKSEVIQNEIKEYFLEKYGVTSIFLDPEFRKKYNNKTSKIEEDVVKALNTKPKFRYNDKEYDLILDGTIIEVDGDYYHPDKLINLSFTQINSAINDKSKIDAIENSPYILHKVKTSVLKEMNEITLDNIKSNSYIPNYSIGFGDVIIPKEYFIEYKDKKGEDKLASNVSLLLKFIRTFQPELPILPNDESVTDILGEINRYDLNRIHMNGDGFNNNCSVKGVNYLKHNFNSYWHSAYNGKKSPIEAWKDDKVMSKVIAYRIGLNKNSEVFDFTLKELVKGLSAYRHTVSFFKPVLAASIYNHYLGDKSNPIVFDPCCGFGGRLLGFKGKYPNGKYIGCEPDVDTFNTLTTISSNMNEVHLFNSKLEDFDYSNLNYDIAFTSIPYFDLEIYKNHVEYDNLDVWKETFLKSLLSIPKLIVNMSESLCSDLGLDEYIDTYIYSNVSHMNKGNKKKEVILKLNF